MNQQRGPIERAFAFCFNFLLAAIALYIGIHLILTVLPWLLAIAVVGAMGTAIFTLIRLRRERW